MKLPAFFQAELDASPLRIEFEPGTKHLKIRAAGRLIGTIPRRPNSQETRIFMNIRQRLRALIKELTQ